MAGTSRGRPGTSRSISAPPLLFPPKRITVNLAPADLPKEGSHYDLPIALGLMAAIGAIPGDALNEFTVLGELGLDGSIAAVAGVLPAAILLVIWWKRGRIALNDLKPLIPLFVLAAVEEVHVVLGAVLVEEEDVLFLNDCAKLLIRIGARIGRTVGPEKNLCLPVRGLPA